MIGTDVRKAAGEEAALVPVQEVRRHGDARADDRPGLGPATADDLRAEGPLHKAKEALLDAAQAKGNADFAAQQKTAPPGKPPLPIQRIKLQADALLDQLIFKLEPK